jgi:hypothetical protein
VENDLVRFLLARLDDDEREIKKMQKATNGSVNGATNGAANGNGAGNGSAKGAPFPSLSRLSVDSAAKREIVGVLQRLLVLRDLPSERPVRDGAVEVLRRLAMPYEDHAGYRAEWRPKRSGV